jgi:hypothetical protein
MKDFNLEAEVRDLVARRDIYGVICRYMRAQDRLLPDLHLSVFHEDAHVDCGPYKGKPEAFVAFAQEFLSKITASHHLIGQVDVQVDGDTAKGEVYFIAQHRVSDAGGETDLFVSGRYIDEYRRRDGLWKIFRRRELVDWVRSSPCADEFLKHNPELNLGDRREKDFSNNRQWPNG